MTNKFKQECKNSTYKNRLGRIEIEDETISNFDNLASIEIVDSCISNGNILGNTNSKTITVNTLKNYNLIDRQINPFIGVKYDDTSEEYIKMGKYTITDETDDKTAQNGVYNGSDDLKKLDQVYVCGIEFTADTVITVLDFYKDVCRQLGLTPKKLDFINDDIPVSGNPFTNNETCRLVLQNIAQVFCTFVEIDWETNEIDLIWFDEYVTETFTKKDYSTLEKNQVVGPINSLVIKESAIDGENVTREQTSKDIISLEIEGKSEQEEVATLDNPKQINNVRGIKNLCDGINQNYYVSMQANNTGKAEGDTGLSIPTNGKKTFTISTTELQSRFRAGCVNELPTSDAPITLYNGKNKDNTNETITINTTGYKYLIVNASDLTKIQIEEGTVANEFVPYGNWLKVKNTGKNLFDSRLLDTRTTLGVNVSFDNSTISLNGVSTKAGIVYATTKTNIVLDAGSYTFSFKELSGSYAKANGDRDMAMFLGNSSNMTAYGDIKLSRYRYEKTFTLTEKTNLYIYFYINGVIQFSNYRIGFQIESGQKSTEYEPYKEISTLIDMNEYDTLGKISNYFELSSINDIKDTLLIQGNKAIINKCIGKIILTGNEDWKIGTPNHRYYIDINNQCDLNYNPISTHFDCSKPIDYKKCLLLQNTDNNLLRINVYNDNYIGNVSNFKLWLKEQYDNGTPVTIYYVLKDTQTLTLNDYYNIDLLDGINNITTNDLLQPNMKIITDYIGNTDEYNGSHIQIQNDVQEINEISIIDNYFLYTEYLRTLAIDNIWNKIKGFTYTDCKLTSYTGKPYLKRGNKIRVQDNDETYFDTYVFSHTFTYDGTFKSVVESPSLTKSQTIMKNNQSVTSYFRKVERICNKIDGKLEDTIEQVNEDGEKISNVTQTVNEINTKIEDNKYYYDEKGNKILISEAVYQLQQTTNGAVSTISTTSGNNIFMNAIGLFGTDYWEGNCKSFTNTELQRQSGQRSCWLLQNTTQKQSVDLKNGNYTVSFIYKKIIPLADVKLKINGKSYDLTKTDFTNFSTTIKVSDNTLIIEFISDTDDSCYILNLMGNIGDVAQPFSNNPNETVTDTIMIGKGLEITSNTMNTKLKADADGVRVVNSYSDEVTSEFTDKGMSTNDLEAKGISKISGLLIMKVNRHIWITGTE